MNYHCKCIKDSLIKNPPKNNPQMHADNLHKYGGCPHSRSLYKYNDNFDQPERLNEKTLKEDAKVRTRFDKIVRKCRRTFSALLGHKSNS